MSYTTMNRYGEVLHIYAPNKAGGYIKGMWWPDFGPMSADYSYQPKMHPTNTIFENIIERGGGKTPKPATEVLRLPPAAAAPASPSGASASSASESGSPQRRMPPRDTALFFGGTYKNGGLAKHVAANLGEGRGQTSDPYSEPGSPSAALPPALRRAPSAPTLAATRTGGPFRSISVANLRDGNLGEELPSWVADKTLVSRPCDAAGLKGSSRLRWHMPPGSGSTLATIKFEEAVAGTLRSMPTFASR